MTAQRLSIRSAKAIDLARRLAKRENRTIIEIVERALETYAVQQAKLESPASFYTRIS